MCRVISNTLSVKKRSFFLLVTTKYLKMLKKRVIFMTVSQEGILLLKRSNLPQHTLDVCPCWLFVLCRCPCVSRRAPAYETLEVDIAKMHPLCSKKMASSNSTLCFLPFVARSFFFFFKKKKPQGPFSHVGEVEVGSVHV